MLRVRDVIQAEATVGVLGSRRLHSSDCQAVVNHSLLYD